MTKALSRLARYIARLPRSGKKSLMVGLDLVLLPLAVWVSFALRLGEPFPYVFEKFWWLAVAVPLLSVPVFVVLGLYRAVIRFMGWQAAMAMLKGVTISSLILAMVTVLLQEPGFPRSVLVLYWLIALVFVAGSRVLARSCLRVLTRERHGRKRVVIYGAGEAGRQAAMALLNGDEYAPVAFVDDDASLHGQEVHGIRVYPVAALDSVLKRYRAGRVLLAIPALGHVRRRAIVASLEARRIEVKTLPDIGDLVSGEAKVDEFREVDVGDLLGRRSGAPRLDLLESGIRGKTVLITGAGGSIGSELARQIVSLGARGVLLFEMSEYALYRIHQELVRAISRDQLDVEITPLLGSVAHGKRLERVMRAWAVDTVYHAAAYKHVPMVEHNLIEGIRNNVFGTWRCAEAAVASGVERFVLVSTDKAVRPTNVMGASKRLAEMVLQAIAARQQATRFAMVRFGNVLESSGSVVPLFREQIRQGGPVTVTDPEVTRYFMTIPEAAELVLQAGSMGEGGEVFVLHMGEPVRIFELARRMIHLMGMSVRDEANPEGDIEIRFIGLRPGEKLYEELLIGENVSATVHPMIMRAAEEFSTWAALEPKLMELDAACHGFDCPQAQRLLGSLVSGYPSDAEVADQLWLEEQEVAASARPAVSAGGEGKPAPLAEVRRIEPSRGR